MASLHIDNPKRIIFSDALIRRKFILDSKSVLEKTHMNEERAVSKNIIRQGYKIVKIPKIVGIHYHSDPIRHVKMEYKRMGISLVISKGNKLRNIIFTFASPIYITYTWIRYSIHIRNLDFGLYKFLISLYVERLKGIKESISKYKIKKKDLS